MARLKTHGHIIEHQVLDNEASKEYRRHVTNIWTATYQLVPPDVHRRNIAERAIHTFKAHFLSILAGIPPSLPNYLWDKLLPQTELYLNLLRQSTITPLLTAWEAFNSPFRCLTAAIQTTSSSSPSRHENTATAYLPTPAS